MYKAVLFDFDGTLCDTGEGIRRSVAYGLEKLGLPTGFLGEIMDADEFAQPDELTDFLQEVYDSIDFGHWFFGHFHRDLFSIGDGRFTCLFDTIAELDPDTFEPMDTE